MQLKTILNRVERYKSFVYGKVRWVGASGRPTIEVELKPRKNSRPVCSGCGRLAPRYDRLPPRRFQFVPLWNMAVYFVYALRRVDCPHCGVKAERVPWATGKCRHTRSYRWFLAGWAKLLSWQEVSRRFHTTWDHVQQAVFYAVRWGLVHREIRGVRSIGTDEIAWQKGHRYLTLVYQIDEKMKRLLWVGRERTEASLRECFQLVLDKSRRRLRFVCSDMWKPYLKVLREQAPQAIHVLDRFHVMVLFNKALDKVRAAEARRMAEAGGKPLLKHSRWCLLKRPDNLTGKQAAKLRELLRHNLECVRAYLQRQDFQRFWEYQHPTWAGRFLDEWCARAKRSRIQPFQKVARTLHRHRELLLNWFRAKGTISSGVVEGLNNKAKLAIRKSYGFRNVETAEYALYHQLGKLPEPKRTHEFV